ncbi:uncharacterized protein LOC133033293 isoform X1 [Cannabis sativa]|uniref:uncharacterized protein LOC133033293 isoform X1 n=1 Tax=Cannabis sativa TaxID=3483 RepID=UPI0029CA1BEA|nr:uncharacterized protein LOC133033293 isoform X1 [Cannabis sativa]
MLEVYFVTQTSAKIDFYTTQLQNYKKGHLSVNEYLLQIKTLVDKLGSFGHRVSIKEHVAEIFKGLPLIYDTFIISVNSRNDQYLIAEIETLLLSQEHQMESHTRILIQLIWLLNVVLYQNHNVLHNFLIMQTTTFLIKVMDCGILMLSPRGAANVNKKSINVATADKVTDEA